MSDNNYDKYYYYVSPTTTQSISPPLTTKERDRYFPDVSVRDLNRNIGILSQPENVVVYYPLSMVRL